MLCVNDMADIVPATNRPPDGLVSKQEVLAATGISARNLVHWRGLGLVPEPVQVHFGGSRGSISYYPPITIPMIRRLCDLRQQTRDARTWLWQLWCEDFPVDIKAWGDARLARLEAALSGHDYEGVTALAATVSKATVSKRKSPAGRLVFDRIKNRNNRQSLISWALAIAAGLRQQPSLYNAEPPLLDLVLKGVGLPSNALPPDKGLRVEQMSITELRKILASADDGEIEQARRDWQTIVGLVDAAEHIDWNMVWPIIEPLVRGVTGSARPPPSKRTRKARRRRPLPPPGIVEFLLALWRDISVRAVFLSYLISVRRSAVHSQILSEILPLAGAALAHLPRRGMKMLPQPESQP
jgi:hypothetical protein